MKKEVIKYNIDELLGLAKKIHDKEAHQEEIMYKILEVANDLREELKK